MEGPRSDRTRGGACDGRGVGGRLRAGAVSLPVNSLRVQISFRLMTVSVRR